MNALVAILRKKVHQLHNTAYRIEKLKSSIKDLKEAKTPNGTKPHCLPYQSEYYDEVFLGSDVKARAFSFEVGRDCSHAEARACMYMKMLAYLYELELEVEKRKQKQLKAETTLYIFG